MTKLATVLVAIGFSTAAFAQQPAPRAPEAQPRRSAPEQQRGQQVMPFETIDKNKDGQLNRDEASAVPGLDFSTADANKNAALDKQEYTVAISRNTPPRG
jgi:hypothetical protein